MYKTPETLILTTFEVSRLTGLSPDRIRQLARCGTLPSIQTGTGLRIFNRRQIEEFKRQREQQGSRVKR